MNSAPKKIGLHLRFTSSLQEIIDQAHLFDVPIFQCFLSSQTSSKLTTPSLAIKKSFAQFLSKSGKKGYVHVSYLVNLASPDKEKAAYAMRRFLREIEIAGKISIFSFVLHPGSCKGATDKEPMAQQHAIERAQSALDQIIRKTGVEIILENSAHGGKNLGGDLKELFLFATNFSNKNKLSFCIDIGHAHAFGYDLSSPRLFVSSIEEQFGSLLSLIHLHDSALPCASKQDKHAAIGEGYIPLFIFKEILSLLKSKNLPIILELPPLPEEKIREQLLLVHTWLS